MSDQIYEHMPKWRRVIRDLASEAGIRKFVKSSNSDRTKSSSALESSDTSNEPEHPEAEE